jgi:hypothetical protein
VCFRHYRALLDHPLIVKSDKLVFNMFSSNSTPFKEVNSNEEMLLVAQLLILSEVGGIVLPASSLVVSSLQPLLHYEAVMYSPGRGEGGEDHLVIGGHRGARLWQMAINMYLDRGMEGGHPIKEIVKGVPEVVTMILIGGNVNEFGPRTRGGKFIEGGVMSRDKLGIKELFTYSMVIGEELERDGNTVKSLGWRRDILGLILRVVWFAN